MSEIYIIYIYIYIPTVIHFKGGVGSMAVAILGQLGYEVVASTGRADQLSAYLHKLGASKVIGACILLLPLTVAAA